MAVWPRVITRGRLKGRTFGSEAEYRKAYQEVTGVSRYQQRVEKAKALGYRGYYERRKTLKRIGGNKELERNLRYGLGPEAFEQLTNFRTTDKRTRIQALEDAARKQGISRALMMQTFYKQVDRMGLRANIR